MLDFLALAAQCSPHVHPETMQRLVSVESSFNPYAIGVVNGRLRRQPKSRDEAEATVAWLDARGYNYSVGLAQVNRSNFSKYGLTSRTIFDVCENLRAGSEILIDCFKTARRRPVHEQRALRDAMSCYYSGDLKRGYRLGYVTKIEGAKARPAQIPVLQVKAEATEPIELKSIGQGAAPSAYPTGPPDSPQLPKSQEVSSLLF